jgi:hypothetical protein
MKKWLYLTIYFEHNTDIKIEIPKPRSASCKNSAIVTKVYSSSRTEKRLLPLYPVDCIGVCYGLDLPELKRNI